jgi:8-hydroxy-5-deazaflavin:NADPH oxidoreductase
VGALALIGGTGAEGMGLALRLAAAGEPILIGSRVPERAVAAAARVRAAVPAADVAGCANEEAMTRADRICLTLPIHGLEPLLAGAGRLLAGKLVVDVIVPLELRDGFFQLAPLAGAASVGELIQARLPSTRVVSAFKNLPAERLRTIPAPLTGDVVVCGDDPAARAEVAALVARIPRLRAVEAGDVRNSRYLEAMTALLANVNRRRGTLASIAILDQP